MTKHPHAELMVQYAQDALETDKPWKRWQQKEKNSVWMDCYGSIQWFPDVKYRRRPETESDAPAKYIHYFTAPVDNVGVMDRVDSILLATHISIYKINQEGHEVWVHDIELPRALLGIFSTHQIVVGLYN